VSDDQQIHVDEEPSLVRFLVGSGSIE